MPTKDSCDTTYRAITAPCWKDDSITIVPPEGLHFQSCKDSACCWAVYEKCNYGDTLFTFNKFQTGTTYEPWFCYQYDSCNVACNWFPSYDSAFISHPRKIDYDIENMILQTKTLPCRNILTTDNNIDILYQDEKKGNMLIEIYNSYGVKILSKTINKNEFIIKQKIELGNIASGLYLYKLNIGNEYLCSGKIMLIKE
ncbi:MAG: T9SS type A sorting domain-containing protein [Candidatus Kapabacteria bacterium]|nr:T9SS type A sorting domain-containing protein [Candidatus Kapabacteria bacterium]